MADVLRRTLQVALSFALLGASAQRVAAAPTAPAGSPSPEEVAKARELFLRAQADESRGDYLSALEKFEQVAETKATASVRFHLGHCSEKLGRLASALHSYNLALREAERENNNDVKRAATMAADALAPRVPHLTILCPPTVPSCSVSLDGRVLSAAELAVFVLVDPGQHRVSARGDGMNPFDTDLVLHEREARTVHITLGSAAAPTPPRPSTDRPPMTAAGPETSPSPSLRTGAWIAAGGAVALTAFGVGSFFGAAGAQDSLERMCATHPSCEDEKSSVRAWDAVALTSFVSAGVLAVVATVLFVQPREKMGHAKVGRGFLAAPGRFAFGATF